MWEGLKKGGMPPPGVNEPRRILGNKCQHRFEAQNINNQKNMANKVTLLKLFRSVYFRDDNKRRFYDFWRKKINCTFLLLKYKTFHLHPFIIVLRVIIL